MDTLSVLKNAVGQVKDRQRMDKNRLKTAYATLRKIEKRNKDEKNGELLESCFETLGAMIEFQD